MMAIEPAFLLTSPNLRDVRALALIALPDAWDVSPTEDLLTRLERLFGDRVATLG